jgi:hypothetical protein
MRIRRWKILLIRSDSLHLMVRQRTGVLASDHARSPIYRAAAPRCLSKKALISPKASFVSGA